MLIVRSPVRISFGGGGTDLPAYYEKFGGGVVGTAIDKYFYSILRERHDGRVQVISSDLRVCENWSDISSLQVQSTELQIPLAVLKEIGSRVSVDLFLASEIPPGTGLGSSASVCVNLLQVLSQYLSKPLTKKELAERAFHIARNVLGKHVGKQDEYAAAFGGLNYISFDTDGTTRVEPLGLQEGVLRELESNLMLFFTGAAHHSWTILQEQERAVVRGSDSTLEALDEVKAIGLEMRDALLGGQLRRFGELLHCGWDAKRRISAKVSTPKIDELYTTARAHGAIGGKITGAGGGGFLLLYCEKDRQPSVRQALQDVREIDFRFDTQGSRVIVNDPFLDHGGSKRTS